MTALDDLSDIPFHEADETRRARILSRLADTELFVALVAEPVGDEAEIRIFDLDGQHAALACDGLDRLADFFGAAVAYASMPGRVLSQMLTAEGRHLLVNPGQVSQMLLDPEALGWLGQSLDVKPEEGGTLRPSWMSAPRPDAVEGLAPAIAERLAYMHGLARSASLVEAVWPDGRRGHLLLLQGTDEARRPLIAKAFAELFTFLPEIDGGVDVGFSDAGLPEGAVQFDIPEPVPVAKPVRDPNAPPILR